MRILITGADGFIGRTFLAALARTEHEVSVLQWPDSPAEALDAGAFEEVLEQDIAEPFRLDREYDIVFHLAALNVTHVGAASEEAYRRVNVLGTQHVVEGVRAKSFVFMSTSKVYASRGEPLGEEAPLAPAPGYAASKLAAEGVCRERFRGEHLTILRPVNVVGSLQAPKALLPVLFQRACAGQPLELFAPARLELQLLAAEDLVQAFLRLIEREDVSGTFNLAPRESIALEDLARRVVELTDSSSELVLSELEAPAPCPVLADRARAELGWEARWDVERILAEYAGGSTGS